MAEEFAVLLRRNRLRRRLTQEALAERAGVSSRTIGEMERARGRSPRPDTVDRLATALELVGDERKLFVDTGKSQFWASRARPRPDGGGAERQLPTDLTDFVGRADELGVLRAMLDRTASGTRLAAVSGPPGVGKTALAVRTGHEFAASFPDGQLYVALRGASEEPADPADVLAQLLRGLGVDGSALPAGTDARAALFRARLAGRRVLLVLDDAGGHRQVEPLLPAGDAAVVVTSRSPLTGLPGVTAIDLRPLSSPAAIELLCRVAGEERVLAEPAAAADLVATCGGLPLAVRIAAARLAARPLWTVGSLARRLSDVRRRLDELRHGDLAVRPGLQVAYRGLTPAAARAFALLGTLDVPSFPDWPVAALLGVAPADGTAALEELLGARLVDELGPDPAGQPRYRFHEVTKAYAKERQAADVGHADWVAALARAGAAWLAMAGKVAKGLHCERFHLADTTDTDGNAPAEVAVDRPLDWFEAERDVFTVLIPACAEAGLTSLARGLAGRCADFYQLRGYYADWQRTTEAALAACRRAGDRGGEAALLRGLGTCLCDVDVEAALPVLRAAHALAEEVGDPAGAAMARKYIGFALGLSGQLDEAEAQLRAAAGELRHHGTRPNEAMTLANLGFVLRQRGDAADAIRTLSSALDIARSCDDLFALAYVTRGLAAAQLAIGQARDAEHTARRAVALFERIGDPIGAAQSLRALGEALAGDPDRAGEAEQALAAAATIFRDRGNDWGLALVELSLGELEVRRGAAAADRLHRTLRFWEDNNIPVLRARTLVALATAAEQAGDPGARELLLRAHSLYREVKAPQAAELAERLGLPAAGT
jgi:transcriptional regulator with XRE-family HTH domain/tetratricopeptide (TPR) repeat protein